MARQEQLVVSPELEELLGFIDQPHEERVKHADRIRELAMMPDILGQLGPAYWPLQGAIDYGEVDAVERANTDRMFRATQWIRFHFKGLLSDPLKGLMKDRHGFEKSDLESLPPQFAHVLYFDVFSAELGSYDPDELGLAMTRLWRDGKSKLDFVKDGQAQYVIEQHYASMGA